MKRNWIAYLLLSLFTIFLWLSGFHLVAAIVGLGAWAVLSYREFQTKRLLAMGNQSIGVGNAEVNSPSLPAVEPCESGGADSESDSPDPDEFVFGPDDNIHLERSVRRYRSYFHTPDYDVIWEEVHEYRIDGTRVFHRVLESKADRYGEIEYEVQDNVVLEHEIRERYQKNVEPGRLESIRKSVEWNEVAGQLKYFILSRHPESLPTAEARRYFRQELQRLQCGFDGVIKRASEFEGRLIDQELLKFELPNGVSMESLSDALSEEHIRSYNITLAEFRDGMNRVKTLRKLLGEER